jgi:hypothetical protein
MKVNVKYRIGAALSAAAISAMGFGLAGATTAGAAPANAASGATGSHARPATAMVGTYEIYANYGSGFVDDGQLYLDSDNSWSFQDFPDGGTWETVGATFGMSDFNGGYTDGAVFGAKVDGANLGSATKPGTFNAANNAEFPWYAVFTSSAIPAHTSSGRHPFAAAAARPDSGHATFPGTYNTFIGGNEDQTVYNSDGTWSMPGFCNAGSYLSFKVKVGTKVTYTDIQADNGCSADQLWMAKEHGATKLGTASKQGIIADSADGGVFNHFYGVLAT